MQLEWLILTTALLLTTVAMGAVAIGEELSPEASGVLHEFKVKDCTGPASGKTLCYYCRYGQRPVICIFTREVNDEIAQLVARVDAIVEANRNSRWAAFVVLLGEDSQAAEKSLHQLARNHNIQNTPLTIYRDTRQRLRSLGLNDQTQLLMRCWRNGQLMGECESGSNLEAKIEQVLSAVEKPE